MSARTPSPLMRCRSYALRYSWAAAGPGPSTIDEDGVSGLLVPPGDPEALARTVQAVVDDPELRARLAAAGPGRAALFSEERMAGAFAALLDGLIGPGRKR